MWQKRSYAIRVRGHLDESWSGWFDGLAVSRESRDTTLLCGEVQDQAALHGIIGKIRDLGLVLLSVQQQGPEDSGRSGTIE